jgi:hypothetical protein
MTRFVSLLAIFLSLGLSNAFVGPTAIRSVVRPTVSPHVLQHQDTTQSFSRYSTRVSARGKGKVPVKEIKETSASKVLGCVRKSLCFLKPCLVSKCIGSLESIGGLTAFLGAEAVTDFLGLSTTASTKLYIRMKGALSMAAGITTLLTVVKGMNVVKAFGYGMIPFIVYFVAEEISGNMNNEWEMPKNILGLGAVITAGTIYGCLTGANWAMNAMKLFAGLSVLEGLAVTLMPKTYMGLFCSNKHLENADHKFAARIAGVTEFHYGILAGALALGVTATKALGYSMIPYFLFTWWALYSGNVDTLSLNGGAIGTSAVVVPILTASLLI